MTALPADLDAALAALAGAAAAAVASDYDGVLAPLRDDPSAAVPEAGVAEALARLAACRRRDGRAGQRPRRGRPADDERPHRAATAGWAATGPSSTGR